MSALYKSLVHRQFFIVCKASKSLRTMSGLPKVYVSHLDSDDSMKISFRYGNSSLIERKFSFLRSKSELLELSLFRIKLKIEDAVAKKYSKKKKKSSEEVSPTASNESLVVSMMCNNQIVDVTVQNTFAWREGYFLKVGDVMYEVCENPPTVASLSLPKIIMAGFPVYPKVIFEHSNSEDSTFIWYRNITKEEVKSLSEQEAAMVTNCKGNYFLKVHEGYFYVASNYDIGHKLKLVCVPVCGTTTGIEEEVISSCAVESGPGKCPFEERHLYTVQCCGDESVRCVSYNILADLYADSDTARNELFPYCPEEALNIDYRKQLFLKEIHGYNADIVCLQEVDRKIFFHALTPVLASSSLQGVFNEKGGQVAEGLACFYRSSKFKEVFSEAIILSEALKSEPVFKNMMSKISENGKLTEKILQRTTALQVVLLECLDEPKRRILVGNTHLYFHPTADNIRLIQATLCIHYLEHLLRKYQQEEPNYITSLLLCGDFNSCPEFGVYELMTKGYIPASSPDWKSNEEEIVSGTDLSHSLSLDSACGAPPYTNYTEAFYGCLDYIFYDKTCFDVKEVVPFPSHEDVIKHKALPSVTFPSDHIALVCTLRWKQSS